MNRQAQLEKAKLYLSPGEVNEDLLTVEYERWENAARAFLRLTPGESLPPAAASQVVYNTVASYHANGDEGLTGSAAGGQSYSYADLMEKLREAILPERKPRL